jgi:glycosyltransferase involved in cell wall biosynthesis
MIKKFRVVFALDAVAHYRERFFEALKERLSYESIDLELVVGSFFKGHNIEGDIPWATKVPLYHIGPLSWLNASQKTREADLLIVAQVLKQTFLFQAILRHISKRQKIALFGHGKLYSAHTPSFVSDTLKRVISRQCHWWFAYTGKSASVVRDEIGFSPERITVVNNAVDTLALSSSKMNLSSEQIQAVRSELKIKSVNTGIFVGGMYQGKHHSKRLDFLIASCFEIRRLVPDFEMIFVGGGPYQMIVEETAQKHPWIHYVGIKKGVEAVPYWAVAKVCLNPGLVGLGILDGFALGVPLITTNVPFHSPEIAYLKNGINAIMVDNPNDPRLFAAAAADLLSDDLKRQEIASAGFADAKEYTNEAMVENFCEGILAALSKPLSA